jgi:hypothetical protein
MFQTYQTLTMNQIMLYKATTQLPNFIVDQFLCQLTCAELKIVLVVIRQTFGWVNKNTGERKKRDRISHYQFRKKTGLSMRIITKAIHSLSVKGLIQVTDKMYRELKSPAERKGKIYLYYTPSYPLHFSTPTSAQSSSEPPHKSDDNNTNLGDSNVATLSDGLTDIKKILAQRQSSVPLS